jgi:hypothetical protein
MSLARRRAALPIAILVFATLVAGCSKYVTSATPQAETELPSRLRLTLRDGSRMVLIEATLQGDSLYGFPFEEGGLLHREHRAPRPIAIALRDIESSERARIDPIRTTGFVVLLLGVAGALIILNALAGGI